MQQLKMINIADQLRGMPVRQEESGEVAGRLADVVLHPTEGSVLGLIVRTVHGELQGLAAHRLSINAADLAIASGPIYDPDHLSGPLACGAKACGELIGTSVVTEAGKLLGRVSEVYLMPEPSAGARVIYRVSGSRLQRFFDEGFLITGDVAHAYSRPGARLIVPSQTKERYTISSPGEKKQPRPGNIISTEKYWPTGEY